MKNHEGTSFQKALTAKEHVEDVQRAVDEARRALTEANARYANASKNSLVF